MTLTFHWYTKVLVENWLAIYFLNLKIFHASVMLWPYLFPFVVVETVVEPQNKVPAPHVLDKSGVTLFTHVPAEDRHLLITDVVKVATGCHLQLHHGGNCQQQWRVLVQRNLSNQTNFVSLGKRLGEIWYGKCILQIERIDAGWHEKSVSDRSLTFLDELDDFLVTELQGVAPVHAQ